MVPGTGDGLMPCPVHANVPPATLYSLPKCVSGPDTEQTMPMCSSSTKLNTSVDAVPPVVVTAR